MFNPGAFSETKVCFNLRQAADVSEDGSGHVQEHVSLRQAGQVEGPREHNSTDYKHCVLQNKSKLFKTIALHIPQTNFIPTSVSTITKVVPEQICAVTSQFTKPFYCERPNIAHI